MSVCGVDEAGRGPVIGPMVVAGVQLEGEDDLNNFGIRDSKKCTPRKRERLAEIIKREAKDYNVMIIPAKDIDYLRKSMTINEIEVNAFVKVMRKLKSDFYYLDSADVNEERFGEEISKKLGFDTRIVSAHKADDTYTIVGAASILAKTRRDFEVRKIARKLENEIDMPLGSGYPADQVTIRFLREWIRRYHNIPPETRNSWKTVKKLLNEQKKLDSF